MIVLNLGLANVTLERKDMPDHSDADIKNYSSMESVRDASEG